MKIDWENLFQPEDFAESELLRLSMSANNQSEEHKAELATKIYRYYMGEQLSKIANAKLSKALAEAPTVFFRPSFSTDGLNREQWVGSPQYLLGDTHSAKLVMVKELSKSQLRRIAVQKGSE